MDQDDNPHDESPGMLSLMGYSLAKEAGQFRKGIELCLKATAKSFVGPDHPNGLKRMKKGIPRSYGDALFIHLETADKQIKA